MEGKMIRNSLAAAGLLFSFSAGGAHAESPSDPVVLTCDSTNPGNSLNVQRSSSSDFVVPIGKEYVAYRHANGGEVVGYDTNGANTTDPVQSVTIQDGAAIYIAQANPNGVTIEAACSDVPLK